MSAREWVIEPSIYDSDVEHLVEMLDEVSIWLKEGKTRRMCVSTFGFHPWATSTGVRTFGEDIGQIDFVIIDDVVKCVLPQIVVARLVGR